MSGTSSIPCNIDDLIVRFFCRETRPDENRFLHEWMRRSTKNRAYFVGLRNVHLASLSLCRDAQLSVEMQWGAFLRQQAAARSAVLPARERRRATGILLRYAALVVIGAFGCALAFLELGRSGPGSAVVDGQESEWIEFSVSFGSRASTSLPDGSRIWVNAGSRISYAPDYNETQREVRLVGEAYFEVTTDSCKPFVVKARDISIVATGTAFNVSAYEEDNSVTTTLVHGAVTIDGEHVPEPIRLVPNQTIEYFSGEDARAKMARSLEASNRTPAARNISVIARVPAVRMENNPEIYTSWKEDRWVIEGERLESLMHKIERRYNVAVYFTGEEIKDYRFNGSFEGETIDEVLKIIHRALPVDYKIDKGTVLLFSNKSLQQTFDRAATRSGRP